MVSGDSLHWVFVLYMFCFVNGFWDSLGYLFFYISLMARCDRQIVPKCLFVFSGHSWSKYSDTGAFDHLRDIYRFFAVVQMVPKHMLLKMGFAARRVGL